jgi:hypothetical protein
MPGSTALNFTSGTGFGVLHRQHGDSRLARPVNDRRKSGGRPGRLVRGPEGPQRARDIDDDRVVGPSQQGQCGFGDADDPHRVRVEYLKGAALSVKMK